MFGAFRGPFFMAGRNPHCRRPTLRRLLGASVVGVIRLYIEPREDIPPHQRPPEHTPVIDVAPELAREVRKRLKRKGYQVHAFPI